MNASAPLPRLMLVTDRRRTRHREMIPLLAEAVRGGVGLIQIREKDLPDDALRELLQQIRAAIPRETRVVVNSSHRVARTTSIGLHLPAAEPLPWSRQSGWRPPLFGRSAHDEGEVRAAIEDQVDYLVLGTVFPTPSKPGHSGGGAELVRQMATLARPLPLFAIGGITVSRIPELIHAGAYGVAVCGAILSANDPRRVAEALTLALQVSAKVNPPFRDS